MGVSTLAIADPDVGSGNLNVRLLATHGTVKLNGLVGLSVAAGADGTSDVTVTGQLAAINTALNGLVFTPEANYSCPDPDRHQRSADRDQPGALSDDDILTITVVAVPDRPSIDAIGPQSTDEDVQSGPIAVTIGDIDTDVNTLTITAEAVDKTLVPSTASNITVGGSGASRNLRDQLVPGLSCTTDVTVTVSDGALTASRALTLTVNAVNDAPVITVPGDQTAAKDTPPGSSDRYRGNLISVADVDACTSNVEVKLAATGGAATLNGTSAPPLTIVGNGTASVTATGPLASVNQALNGLTFTPTPSGSGSGSLKVDTSDLGNTGAGGTKTDTDTIAISVTGDNDPPTFVDDHRSALHRRGHPHIPDRLHR